MNLFSKSLSLLLAVLLLGQSLPVWAQETATQPVPLTQVQTQAKADARWISEHAGLVGMVSGAALMGLLVGIAAKLDENIIKTYYTKRFTEMLGSKSAYYESKMAQLESKLANTETALDLASEGLDHAVAELNRVENGLILPQLGKEGEAFMRQSIAPLFDETLSATERLALWKTAQASPILKQWPAAERQNFIQLMEGSLARFNYPTSREAVGAVLKQEYAALLDKQAPSYKYMKTLLDVLNMPEKEVSYFSRVSQRVQHILGKDAGARGKLVLLGLLVLGGSAYTASAHHSQLADRLYENYHLFLQLDPVQDAAQFEAIAKDPQADKACRDIAQALHVYRVLKELDEEGNLPDGYAAPQDKWPDLPPSAAQAAIAR